jgi:hypothetical protein
MPVQHVPVIAASHRLVGQQEAELSASCTFAACDAEGDLSRCLSLSMVNVAHHGAVTFLPVAAESSGSSRQRRATAPLPSAVPHTEGMCAGELVPEKRQHPRHALDPGSLHNPFSSTVPFSFALPLAERPRGRLPGGVTVPAEASQLSSASEYRSGLAPIASHATQAGDGVNGALPSSGSPSRNGYTVASAAAFMPTGRPQRSPRSGLQAISPRATVASGTGFFGMGSQSMGPSLHAALVGLGPS